MFNKTVSGTLLVSGTTIGAGMLGIPLLTAKAGFLPAVAITAAVWLFMLATGYLYLEATLWMHEGANVLSISKRFLGKSGKWIAGAVYLFLYYCLMVAYYAAGAPIFIAFVQNTMGFALSGVWGYLAFGMLFGGIVAAGLKWVDRINYLLMTAMFLAYFALLGAGSSILSFERFERIEWSEILFAAPILFSAFGYHNVIPSLVSYFNRDARVVRRSIFYGTLIPLAVFILWQGLILGAVPLGSIEEALREGMPATQSLQTLTGSPWVMQMGQFFAFFAIVTSMLGVAFSLVDFLGDGCGIKRTGATRWILCAIAFAPPFALSSIDPAIFVTALGFAGGFGEAFLNGLLPVAIVWAGRYVKPAGFSRRQLPGEKGMLVLLFGLAVAVSLLEIAYLLSS